MIKLATTFYRKYPVYAFAILISLLLSVLLGYRDSVINPDGICYVLSAEMLSKASFRDAIHLCPQAQWPFYSTLIYAFSQLSHFSYGVSAHLLNTVLSLISVVAFIKVVEKLGGSQRVLLLAALVILFDHQFNLLRDNIIRDHGFWACYLVSIYMLLKYFDHPKVITALLWNLCLIFATLFRIEGTLFLLAMPFVAWFNFGKPLPLRAKMFMTLNMPLLLVGSGFILWQFAHPEQSVHQLGRISEVIHQLQSGVGILADRFMSIRAAMVQYILPAESLPDANVVVFFVWISWYLYNVMLTLSFVYTISLVYAFMSRSISFSANHMPVIVGYIVINLLMTMGFLAETLFISKRYLVALTLVLMVFIPFAINDLISKWKSKRHRVLLIFLVVLFTLSSISSVVQFGRSKFYIRTAGNWMADNIPAKASLYVNDFQLMYYSSHFGMRIFEILPTYLQVGNVTQGKWKQYDYLALRLRKKGNDQMTPLLKELMGVTPMKIFSDKHGNRVAVYKLHEI